MKRIFILLALLAGMSAQAQDKKPTPAAGAQSYIGLTGGVNFPLGSFGKGDYNDDKSGYANTGFNIGITGVYYFKHSHFGIGGVASLARYGFKGAQSLADGYKEAFDIDSSTVYVKGHHQSFNILVGPYYNFAFGSKLGLDIHVLGGVVNATLPGFEVFIEDQEGNNFAQEKAKKSAFGLQGGAALHYYISKHFNVFVGVDYTYANPSFDIDNVNRPVNAGRKIETYHQPLTSLQTNVGVAYGF
ncbi:MAG TPA: outer membrane beta-barrel protein [Chitinophaga sp.]